MSDLTSFTSRSLGEIDSIVSHVGRLKEALYGMLCMNRPKVNAFKNL